jgi:tripartite-type tricarboxylate transporter receptor subunit TctC
MKIARQVVLGAAFALGAFGQASAQDWPTHSVTVVVPVPAGVASDIIARVVFEQVGKQVGQTFVIENRPGAGGTIGANMVAKAAPDGHTILVYGSIAAANALYARLPYDTVADFDAGGSVWRDPACRGDGGRALQHAGRIDRCCEGEAR